MTDKDPMVRAVEGLTEVLGERLHSPNVSDANMEPANLVDTTNDIARGLHRIAAALEKAVVVLERKLEAPKSYREDR